MSNKSKMPQIGEAIFCIIYLIFGYVAGITMVVIKRASDKWTVYATDERASKIISGETIYDSEEEALDNFIRRLRALNKLRKAF